MTARSNDPRRVRAERVDQEAARGNWGSIGGGWQQSARTRQERVVRPIRRLLDPVLPSLADADEIVVVPDLHYPYHPSTGVVTDPAVVSAVLEHLGRETTATLSVAGASTEAFSMERTAAFLGYPAILDRTGASLLDCSTGVPSRWASPDGESVRVPDPLLDASVVIVPSLRPTRAGPVAGAMRTLATVAGAATESAPTPVAGERVHAVTEAVAPELAIVDATVAFAGEPVAANLLFAGEPVTVDVVASDLLGRAVTDDAALVRGLDTALPTSAFDGETVSIEIDGAWMDVDGAAMDVDRAAMDVDGAAMDVNGGAIEPLGASNRAAELPPDPSVNRFVSMAYGLYARVAGDAVPPQLEVEQ